LVTLYTEFANYLQTTPTDDDEMVKMFDRVVGFAVREYEYDLANVTPKMVEDHWNVFPLPTDKEFFANFQPGVIPVVVTRTCILDWCDVHRRGGAAPFIIQKCESWSLFMHNFKDLIENNPKREYVPPRKSCMDGWTYWNSIKFIHSYCK